MFKHTLRKLLQGTAVLAVSALMAVPALAQKTKITVYTALENDQLGAYKQAFEAANNDVEIAWVRDSTGVITARLLAEKDNPRADVIWGLGASSIALFDSMGMLQPYTPKGVDQLKPAFKSDKSPTTWTGMDAWLAVMCFNTIEGGKKNMPKPAAWADLTNPVYKDSDRDAQPGLLGYRLPGGLRLAADHGREGRLGVHGQAAPEHRGLHPFGLRAVRAGGQG